MPRAGAFGAQRRADGARHPPRRVGAPRAGAAGGLWRTLADFWRTSGGLWRTLADFWRTSGGLLADRVSLPATPREGHNCQSVSSVSFACRSTRGSQQSVSQFSSVSSVFLPLHAREGLPGGLLADFWRTLADSGGFWRTGGLDNRD
eukprot:gene15185-biopygen11780